ncbi:MAG: alpha/beta hydrolase [Gammaproteobacteria bacterium]|nr:alpha/beta hydrolase [Gammaproteobacteria bacterium]
MPLHPQCAAITAAAAQAGAPFSAGSAPAVRLAYAAGTANFVYDPGPLARVENLTLAGTIPARLYQAAVGAPAGGFPALVYFHGGGWAAGDLETHDHLCRHLALAGGFSVVAVDYRLAPEHPFPAALDDCLAATRALALRAEEWGIDPRRLAVGGDSAGGSLATVVCLALRDAGEHWLRAQLLLYPAVDFAADTDSLRTNGQDYLLTTGALEMFTNWYLPDRASRTDPKASPLRAASHAGLPAAIIQTAEFDPLRDEGQAYAAALRAAGVAVDYHCYAGMIHGFARMGARIDAGKQALDDAARQLRALLS